MKKLMTYIFSAILLVMLAASCQTEITMPYRSITPMMVIEGSVCQDSAVVYLTQSIDMEEPFEKMDSVSGASVRISYDGTELPLVEKARGVYGPEGEFHGKPGTAYTLKVSYEGNEYSSTSVMNPSITILKSGYRFMDIAGIKCWLYSATLLDTPGQDNYYVYYVYKHGEMTSWDILYDLGNDGGFIMVDVPIMTWDTIPEGTELPEDFKMVENGDEVRVEIRSIDKKTYDYLYSLAVTIMTYANAAKDFTVKSDSATPPVCLGYFSSYSSVSTSEVFNSEVTYTLEGLFPGGIFNPQMAE